MEKKIKILKRGIIFVHWSSHTPYIYSTHISHYVDNKKGLNIEL